MSAGRKAAGNSQRLAKTGACRGFASKPAPFFNARRCSFLFPHFSQGGDCCALRATMIYYDLTSSILSFSRPRPARSHCENSGSCDVIGASARSDRAKSEVFRDRSASAGVVIRYFSPCLIFWCFWIKPKAQKKKIHDRRNRFFGKNSDAKIGCTVSAGRSLRNTSTAADLRGRRLRPARRKGAATPDSGRAADRTEETSAGKRRER